MHLIRTIRDGDFGFNFPVPETYRERRAARAIVFDAEGRVALLNVKSKRYHKLPGGGIEEGESVLAALMRELMEEIGCEVANIVEIGAIEEYRNKKGLHQVSYCFAADLVGEKGVPNFETGEIEAGFEPIWMLPEVAKNTFEREVSVDDTSGRFINLRDYTFFRLALEKQASK